MRKFPEALLCALMLVPATALAAPAGGSFVDLYFVPRTDLEVAVPGLGTGDDDGDGFGIKGLIRSGEHVFLTGEFQKVSYDGSGIDRDEFRIGLGLAGRTGLSLYAEYLESELDGTDADGPAIHLRLSGDPAQPFQLYGDVGYLMLEDDSEDLDGWEFTLGAVLALNPGFGLFADYRRMNLEGDQSAVEVEFSDVRVGARLMFGGRPGGGGRGRR